MQAKNNHLWFTNHAIFSFPRVSKSRRGQVGEAWPWLHSADKTSFCKEGSDPQLDI